MRGTKRAWKAGVELVEAAVGHVGDALDKDGAAGAARALGRLAAGGMGLRIEAAGDGSGGATASFEMTSEGTTTASVELQWAERNGPPAARWRDPLANERTTPWHGRGLADLQRRLGVAESPDVAIPADADAAIALAGIGGTVRAMAAADETGVLATHRRLRAVIACALHADSAMRQLSECREESLGLPARLKELGRCKSRLEFRWKAETDGWKEIETLVLWTEGHDGWSLEARPAVNAARSEQETSVATFTLRRSGRTPTLSADSGAETCLGYWDLRQWRRERGRDAVRDELEALASHPEARTPDALRAAAEDWRWKP